MIEKFVEFLKVNEVYEKFMKLYKKKIDNLKLDINTLPPQTFIGALIDWESDKELWKLINKKWKAETK